MRQFTLLFVLICTIAADDWTELTSSPDARKNWREFQGKWLFAADARIDSRDERSLTGDADEAGGVLISSRGSRTRDLFTKQKYTDLEAHIEFMIGKKSNAGVKFMGLYEIQIYDSFGKAKLTGSDCGGIYPRAEQKPKYHYLDDGVPPRVNACKPAGEWQTLDVVFIAPKFEGEKKISCAKFVKVVFNGQVIHENVDCEYPTGSAWRLMKEVPEGPFMLQCDHGPVAYRNVRIRPINGR